MLWDHGADEWAETVAVWSCGGKIHKIKVKTVSEFDRKPQNYFSTLSLGLHGSRITKETHMQCFGGDQCIENREGNMPL